MTLLGPDIESQVGAAQGLWTHSPVDWAGNEPPGTAKPAGWPNNAKDGYLGSGTRPGGAATQDGPAGSPVITGVVSSSITTTTAIISFSIVPAPTSCRVNYGTTQLVAQNAAGTATNGPQNVNLSGLTTQTVYWFSVQATNAQGTAVTHLLSFKTF
jgi:hypothetical protein